ncbi:transposase [Agrobacterium tumefaciens]|nr:transposase [Agrobacterium tumefaciens]
MGIDLALPTWTKAFGQAAQHRSSRGYECVALHHFDGLSVANAAQRFPPFTTVQACFYEWRATGLWGRINHHLVMEARELEDREASPSTGVIDSQSVKTTRKAAEFRVTCPR